MAQLCPPAVIINTLNSHKLNPVVANMVETPGEYRWSSYPSNAWGEKDTLIAPHKLYLAIGNNREGREHSCRRLFKAAILARNSHEISIDPV